MSSRSWFSGLTGYFVYILLVATLGPLLFGFHLVHRPLDCIYATANSIRVS
jgi:hypothetical protein